VVVVVIVVVAAAAVVVVFQVVVVVLVVMTAVVVVVIAAATAVVIVAAALSSLPPPTSPSTTTGCAHRRPRANTPTDTLTHPLTGPPARYLLSLCAALTRGSGTNNMKPCVRVWCVCVDVRFRACVQECETV
jgi:hypothetical protein